MSLQNMAEQLTEFFRQASFYRYHVDFQKHEREYKIQLHNTLKESHELLFSHSRQWLPALERAIKSEDDNIIYWEYKSAFLKWLNREPLTAFEAVRALWREGPKGFSSFAGTLAEMGLRKPGAQLEITSTLLMTLSPYEFPPVKVDSFSRAMKIAGWVGLYQTNNAAENRRGTDRTTLDERILSTALPCFEDSQKAILSEGFASLGRPLVNAFPCSSI